jgi:hypothetical protein
VIAFSQIGLAGGVDVFAKVVVHGHHHHLCNCMCRCGLRVAAKSARRAAISGRAFGAGVDILEPVELFGG